MTTSLRRSATALSAVLLSALGVLSLHSSGCSSSDSDGATADAGLDRGPIIEAPDAEAWTPVNLFPAIWLESDGVTEAGGKVTQWADKSGNGNNAAQTDANLQPKPVDFNGHKAVSFGSQSGMTIKDAKSLQWGKDDFAFFTVARYSGVNDPLCADLYLKGVQMLVTPTSDADGGGKASHFLMGTGESSRIQTKTTNGYADGKAHVTSFRRKGSQLELRVDFQPAGSMTAAPVDISAVGTPGYVGAQNDGNWHQWLVGDIATLIGVHATVSDDDLAKTETYLKDRYGL